MGDKLTDAELIRRLKALYEHDANITKAALALGIGRPAFRESVNEAKKRGLTKDSPVIDDLQRAQQQVKTLEKALEAARKDQDTAAAIRRNIFSLAEHSPAPPEWLEKGGKPGSRGMPALMVSDLHWGEVVRAEEVGGVNEYNEAVGRKRMKKLKDVTIDLCYNHMGRANTEYPGMVLMLGGDMITGDIHEELMASNDRTPQQSINDLTDELAGLIDAFAGKFGKLFIPCVVGNHGRSTKKMRMKGRVYTSYEWLIYCNLERYFKSSKHIHFYIPGEADAYFKIYGHRYLLTHGDSLGVKGGDGIIGAMGPIMRGAIKVGRSEAQIGRDFDTIVMGHWHQSLWLPGVIVNNAFKGYDEYARLGLRAPYNRPSQSLWFTHPEHGITARWEVFLEPLRTANADKEWVTFQK